MNKVYYLAFLASNLLILELPFPKRNAQKVSTEMCSTYTKKTKFPTNPPASSLRYC